MTIVAIFRGRRDTGGPLHVTLPVTEVIFDARNGCLIIDKMRIKRDPETGLWTMAAALRKRVGVAGNIHTVRISQRERGSHDKSPSAAQLR